MSTFGSQDRLRSEPVSSYSVGQDGVQLQSNQRRHDGFELLSSRPSRQINSGDRLERLEQVVESIALRLGLLVDNDEANVFEQGNQHGGRSPESEDCRFSKTLPLFTEQIPEEWERSQKDYTQKQVPKECQFPDQVQTEERKPIDLPQTGRLKFFQNEWEKICTDKTVLNYVKGLEIPLISKPFQHKIPDSTPESLTEFHLLKLEIDKLLQKGAIEQVESLEPGSFVSRLFTVPKSNGQRRPVINLRQLNKHVYNQKFRIESLGNIRSLLKPRGFMIKIDLQDAYMSVPVAPKSRSLLVFIFNGKIYRFKVMPFGLNSAPRIFTKLFKPILRLLRSQGMLLIIYLDDILLIAPTADLCLAQGKFLMKLLQDLGFLVNINKSVLTPTQRIIFLGFLIDSVNMTISLPEEKQLAIIQKANSLLAQNLVSI